MMIFVFSGFRDKKLEEEIKENIEWLETIFHIDKTGYHLRGPTHDPYDFRTRLNVLVHFLRKNLCATKNG